MIAILILAGVLASDAKAPPTQTIELPAATVGTLSKVHLTPVQGYDSDSTYARAIAARAKELSLQVAETTSPQARADLLLAAANMILARELEPACTAKLLGFSGSQIPFTEDRVRDAFDRVDAALMSADTALDEARDLSPPPEQWLAEASDKLSALGALAHGLRVYLLPEKSKEWGDIVRRASSRLSVLLEDTRPEMAAAANLWQACLRAQESDPSRVMSVLELALFDPARSAMPYAFFARLLRCQVLAAHGGYAEALALLTQMEDVSAIWFDSSEERADALRAITFVEVQTIKSWHDSMTLPANAPERTWCVDRINALTQARFTEEDASVLRLSTAIPIIAAPEDAARHHQEDNHSTSEEHVE